LYASNATITKLWLATQLTKLEGSMCTQKP
jgi:hypothetical protein